MTKEKRGVVVLWSQVVGSKPDGGHQARPAPSESHLQESVVSVEYVAGLWFLDPGQGEGWAPKQNLSLEWQLRSPRSAPGLGHCSL